MYIGSSSYMEHITGAKHFKEIDPTTSCRQVLALRVPKDTIIFCVNLTLR